MRLKRLLIALGVLVFVYFGAVLGNSFYAEKRYNDRLHELQTYLADNMPELRIVETSYQRGLFNSRSRFVLEWNMRETYLRQDGMLALSGLLPVNPVRLVVENQIRTGPWLGSQGLFGLMFINSTANFDPASVSAQFQQSFNGQPFVVAQSKIGYIKDRAFTVWNAPFNINVDADQIRYNGMKFEYQTTLMGKVRLASLEMPYLLLQNPNGKLQVNNLLYHAEGGSIFSTAMENSVKLYVGDERFTLDQFTMQFLDTDLVMKNINIQSTDSEKKGVYSSLVVFQSEGQYQGAPFQNNIQVRLEGLNFRAMNKLQRFDNEKDFEAKRDYLEKDGAELFQFEPTLTIDPFTITYNGQEAQARLRISVKSLSAEEFKSRLSLDDILMNKINLQADFSMPVAWATPEFLGSLQYTLMMNAVKNGYILRNGRQFTGTYNIDYGTGRVEINGRQM